MPYLKFEWQQRDSNSQPLSLYTTTQPFSQTGLILAKWSTSRLPTKWLQVRSGVRIPFQSEGNGKLCLECMWSENRILFLNLNNIHFLRVLGKIFGNNAPPTILCNTPSWCNNINNINATHFSTLPTLAHHHPLYPHWRNTHVTNSVTKPTLDVIHTGMPPTQTHHPH